MISKDIRNIKRTQPIEKSKINSEDIISESNDEDMELFTHFNIEQFGYLYSLDKNDIEPGINIDSKLTPKTRFWMALIYCQFNEKWKIFAHNVWNKF